MTQAKKIFQNMPPQEKRRVLNEIINVQGLKSPMTKQGKIEARRNYGSPNRGERNLLPLLFHQSVIQNYGKVN